MKISYSFLLIFVLSMLSCTKAKNFYEELGQGAYLTLVKLINSNLNANDPASAVSETLSANGAPVESVNLYVSATPTLDITKWKLLKNFPMNGEITLSATNTQIANALGLTPGALTPGNVFYLYNEVVTKDGRKFSMANTSAGDLESQPSFNVAMQWRATVVCPYNTVPFNNQIYLIVKDEWDDFKVGDEISVILGPGTNQITLVGVFPTADAHQDLVININPASGVASVPKYTYGAYSAGGTKYTAATTGGSNFVFACTQTIDILLNHVSTSGSNFGNYRLILKKK